MFIDLRIKLCLKWRFLKDVSSQKILWYIVRFVLMHVKWLEFMQVLHQHVNNVQGVVYTPLGALKTKEFH